MDQQEMQHEGEPHDQGLAERLNWLRAGVLGANDGIVSVAAVVVGVAGATTATGPVVAAGAAAAIGGAISMALGEYVSVSSSADSQKALIEKERRELAEMPEEELAELAGLYEAKGLSRATAQQVARELTEHDVLKAHLDVELQLDEDEVLNPWNAAIASAIAFTVGAALPFATAVILPVGLRIPVTFAAVLLALAVTGATGARLGGASVLRPTLRVLIGGAAALAVTFAIGSWLGVSGIV
ncbi:VIT family protein [Paeniglutamicibacter sulfureus]|uniref:VIT1/CCC1 transporter family protein n=1 Tax=Paeniglutamicibacter sulfureus TaxID=43666 RepID=UPI002666F3ED|nr:VIT family protein [Paeniglutamicibacter sulfureus]MDO2935161.1 VIT family protein [Paeniglutamicibacter sulfureus]